MLLECNVLRIKSKKYDKNNTNPLMHSSLDRFSESYSGTIGMLGRLDTKTIKTNDDTREDHE